MLSPQQPEQSANDRPKWATFFTLTEYHSFITAIKQYFDEREIAHQIKEGMVVPVENELGFDKMGLFNLAQVCKQDSLANYAEIINGHFDSIIAAHQFMKEFESKANDFEVVKEYVGLRLYHQEYAQNLGRDKVLAKPLVGDIIVMLIFDLPQSIMNIQPQYLAKWDKTLDELFELGQQNIQDKYDVEIHIQQTDLFSLYVAHANHFFTPNIALDLENYPELLGRKGALIGLPHRHTALIYPINSMEVVQAINLLIPAVHGMHQEGPGSLSNMLFWYNEGQFTPLPYQLADDNLQFQPPENFVELLNQMSQEN